MTYPDPDMCAYGGEERRGPTIRTYRLAKWWKRWPRNCHYVNIEDERGARPIVYDWLAWSTCPRYRGRAWPRFWLAKVEVVGA